MEMVLREEVLLVVIRILDMVMMGFMLLCHVTMAPSIQMCRDLAVELHPPIRSQPLYHHRGIKITAQIPITRYNNFLYFFRIDLSYGLFYWPLINVLFRSSLHQ